MASWAMLRWGAAAFVVLMGLGLAAYLVIPATAAWAGGVDLALSGLCLAVVAGVLLRGRMVYRAVLADPMTTRGCPWCGHDRGPNRVASCPECGASGGEPPPGPTGSE